MHGLLLVGGRASERGDDRGTSTHPWHYRTCDPRRATARRGDSGVSRCRRRTGHPGHRDQSERLPAETLRVRGDGPTHRRVRPPRTARNSAERRRPICHAIERAGACRRTPMGCGAPAEAAATWRVARATQYPHIPTGRARRRSSRCARTSLDQTPMNQIRVHAEKRPRQPARPPTTTSRARCWWSRADRGLVILALLYLVSLPLVAHRMTASDAIEYYVYDRSIYFDHDLDFTNDYAGFYARNPKGLAKFKEGFIDKRNPAGNAINNGPGGSALLWAPFFVGGDLIARAAPRRGIQCRHRRLQPRPISGPSRSARRSTPASR